MRLIIRFLVLLGLLLGACSTVPLVASADPSAGSSSSGSSSSGPSSSGPSSSAPSSSAPSSPGSSSGSSSPDPSSTPPEVDPTDGDPSASSTPSAGKTTGSPASRVPHALAGTASATPKTVRDSHMHTTVTSHPHVFSLFKAGTFTYRTNRPRAKFRCRLLGPKHHSRRFITCPVTSTSASSTQGGRKFRNLSASIYKYHFSVQAYLPRVSATSTTTAVPETRGSLDSFSWRIYSVYSRSHRAPSSGASFNTPTGGWTSRRTNLARAIRTINSMPGYRQALHGGPCPTTPSLWPSTIRVSLYSMTDGAFSEAMRAANHRCVSVQILMNNHLSSATDYAWKRLVGSLGSSVYAHGKSRRSFAKRCHFGCRGYGVLHTKMYLFDSQSAVASRSRHKIRHTVMVGSSNMTSNAAGVQWNDLYTIRNNTKVHADYMSMFRRMKAGHKSSRLYRFSEGKFTSIFWPQGHSRDPYKSMFDSVSCSGASGGSGINGHTVLYVNMHAWFGTRGLALARQLRGLHNRGCYVRVLYSFMSYKVYKTLGRDSRMSVRRTMFSHNGHSTYLYSHLKNINISGNVNGDRSSWVVYTGSNNFTNQGTHFDEVALRIKSHAAYRSYVRHFKYISAHKSASTYANYSEPTGGGRAP